MNKNLIHFLNKLKNASLAKKSNVIFKNVNNISKYTEILYNEGFIQSYNIEKDIYGESNIIVILRQFENKILTNKIKLLSSPSKTKILSYSQLTQANIKNNMIVLSTSKGIVEHGTCLKKILGGVAIFSC